MLWNRNDYGSSSYKVLWKPFWLRFRLQFQTYLAQFFNNKNSEKYPAFSMLETAFFPRKLAFNFLFSDFCITFYVGSGSRDRITVAVPPSQKPRFHNTGLSNLCSMGPVLAWIFYIASRCGQCYPTKKELFEKISSAANRRKRLTKNISSLPIVFSICTLPVELKLQFISFKDDRKGLCLLSKLQLNRSRHTSKDSVGKMKALSLAKINRETLVSAGMTKGRLQ